MIGCCTVAAGERPHGHRLLGRVERGLGDRAGVCNRIIICGKPAGVDAGQGKTVVVDSGDGEQLIVQRGPAGLSDIRVAADHHHRAGGQPVRCPGDRAGVRAGHPGNGHRCGNTGDAGADLPHQAVKVRDAAVLPVVCGLGKDVARPAAVPCAAGLAALAVPVRLPFDRRIIGVGQGVVVAAFGKVGGGAVPGAVVGRAGHLPVRRSQQGQSADDEPGSGEKYRAGIDRPIHAVSGVRRVERLVIGIGRAGSEASHRVVICVRRERVAVFYRAGDISGTPGIARAQILVHHKPALDRPAVMKSPMQGVPGRVGSGHVSKI